MQTAPHARLLLPRPGAARYLHTDASRRRAFAATSFLRLAALQRPERKVRCQVSSFSQPACAAAHRSVRGIVQAQGIGKPKQDSSACKWWCSAGCRDKPVQYHTLHTLWPALCSLWALANQHEQSTNASSKGCWRWAHRSHADVSTAGRGCSQRHWSRHADAHTSDARRACAPRPACQAPSMSSAERPRPRLPVRSWWTPPAHAAACTAAASSTSSSSACWQRKPRCYNHHASIDMHGQVAAACPSSLAHGPAGPQRRAGDTAPAAPVKCE